MATAADWGKRGVLAACFLIHGGRKKRGKKESGVLLSRTLSECVPGPLFVLSIPWLLLLQTALSSRHTSKPGSPGSRTLQPPQQRASSTAGAPTCAGARRSGSASGPPQTSAGSLCPCARRSGHTTGEPHTLHPKAAGDLLTGRRKWIGKC